MNDPVALVTVSTATLAGVGMLTMAGLSGWRGWLQLKRVELDQLHGAPQQAAPTAGARIEIADLKERIRKLEAIAAGVEL